MRITANATASLDAAFLEPQMICISSAFSGLLTTNGCLLLWDSADVADIVEVARRRRWPSPFMRRLILPRRIPRVATLLPIIVAVCSFMNDDDGPDF